MTTRPDYFHVLGHMDEYLAEEYLTLEQLLNKRCDILAKSAIDTWLRNKRAGIFRTNKQLLPCESAAVLIQGRKITGDIAEAIRFAKGMEEAERFLTEEQGWSKVQFREVDWRTLHRVIQGKPKGFSTWLSKQHSGWCGTAVQIGYYSGDEDPDDRCPNCGLREDASHLCVCKSPERTRLLHDNVSELEMWLHREGKTDPEVAYWIGKYIRGRGDVKFAELGQMSPHMLELALSQDRIGFRNFMEGRISKKFLDIQSYHLMDADGYLSGYDWVKIFITKILQITHSQWIFRNMTLHDRNGGELRRREAQKMRSEAEHFAHMNPMDLKEQDRWLLELDGGKYIKGDGHYIDKCYFIAAARAAIRAGSRRVKYKRHKKTNRDKYSCADNAQRQ